MNMGEYGGRLQRMGLANLEAMAQIENDRRWEQYAADQLRDKEQGQAVGALIGGVAGGVKGYYNQRKDAHEQRQQDAEDAWRSKATKRQNAEMENRIYQRMGYPAQPLPEVPDRPEAKPFDFVADTHQRFVDLGWAD